jgi:hypothetical protein
MNKNKPLIENVLTLPAVSFNPAGFADLGEGLQKHGCLFPTYRLTDNNDDIFGHISDVLMVNFNELALHMRYKTHKM